MSTKRPSLAGFTRPKPGGAPAGAEAGAAARAPGPAGASRRAPASPSVPAVPPEEDMHALTVRIPKPTSKALKIRAMDEERPVVALIRDAIDDYLRRHRS